MNSIVARADLKAPFPYFGGKSTVAALVWERLGDVDNYIEPFMGSAAVLLKRPDQHKGRVETVNDADAYLANFWRATKHDPEAVVDHCDWPVNETDLHARHKWLVLSPAAAEFRERMKADPEFYDPKVAGWWVWGACCWIGSGWCSDRGVGWEQSPALNMPGGTGVLREGRPQLGDAYDIGRGVNASAQLPALAANDGRGTGVQKKRPRAHRHKRNGGGDLPHGVEDGTCDQRREWLLNWFCRLQDRYREVRVCCGHWNRVCDSRSTLTRLGTTGVFLDPPYRKKLKDGTVNRAEALYANDEAQDVDALCDEVGGWCLKWQDTPDMRIALCGLDGEYDLPGWDCMPWKTNGGYGNQSGGVNENAARERIWFSPGCKPPLQATLF